MIQGRSLMREVVGIVSGIRVVADGLVDEFKRLLPWQRKTQRGNLALLVATMLEVRSANLMDLAAALPRDADRTDMRYQWIARVLGNELIDPDAVMAPFAAEVLARAAADRRGIVLILDQSKVSDRHQVLMVALRHGERALPLAWRVETTEGAIGFDTQKALLEAVAPWMPADAKICLMGDRFYGTADLISLCQERGWSYRLRRHPSAGGAGLGDEAASRERGRDGRNAWLDEHAAMAAPVDQPDGVASAGGPEHTRRGRSPLPRSPAAGGPRSGEERGRRDALCRPRATALGREPGGLVLGGGRDTAGKVRRRPRARQGRVKRRDHDTLVDESGGGADRQAEDAQAHDDRPRGLRAVTPARPHRDLTWRSAPHEMRKNHSTPADTPPQAGEDTLRPSFGTFSATT